MISVVIPLYNEEENVQELCRCLVEVLNAMHESYEILFIDDGSTDGSYARLLEIKKRMIISKLLSSGGTSGRLQQYTLVLTMHRGISWPPLMLICRTIPGIFPR